MDESDLLAITLKKIENKGSHMRHTKKMFKKKNLSGYKKKFKTHSRSRVLREKQNLLSTFIPLLCLYLMFYLHQTQT